MNQKNLRSAPTSWQSRVLNVNAILAYATGQGAPEPVLVSVVEARIRLAISALKYNDAIES